MYQIKSVTLVPLNTITAVYCQDDGLPWRNPIVFAVVVNKGDGDGDDELELWDADVGGMFCDCQDDANFIGLEYNDKEEDWTKVIESYLKHKKR